MADGKRLLLGATALTVAALGSVLIISQAARAEKPIVGRPIIRPDKHKKPPPKKEAMPPNTMGD